MATSEYAGKKLEKNTKQFRNTNLKTAFGTRKTKKREPSPQKTECRSTGQQQCIPAETLDFDKEYVQRTGHNFKERYEEHINRLIKL